MVCLSEHEGFCVPVVEALHWGLPVIALDAGAVGETMAAAGVLIADKKQPEAVAALVKLVLEDESLTASLIAAGRERRMDFLPDAVFSTYNKLLLKVFA
jgi:glycosyltransferase involved in cell wall biosynthesis